MKIFKQIKKYKKIYKNWVTVMWNTYKQNKNIGLEFKNGKRITLPREIASFINNYDNSEEFIDSLEFNYETGILKFLCNNSIVNMKFFDNGKINGEFASFTGDYNFLEPIKDSIVIDIGANIGDSTVWFGVMKASKIIALEPYPYSFKISEQNIKQNNLSEKVVLLNTAYGKDGFIEIEDKISGIGTVLEEYKGGIKIPLISLKTILEKYVSPDKNMNILLKMDCEGCEYNIIQELKETLHQFKKILIEYHNGYEDLKNKLEESGFSVTYTKPNRWYNPETKRYYIQGYLYATNILAN